MVHTKLQKKLLYRNAPRFILVSVTFIWFLAPKLKPLRWTWSSHFWTRCQALPKLKPHFGPHKAHFVVYPLLQSRVKPHHPLPEAPLPGYAVV
jgi:hypothetical protein